jgi:hypothetical protein
MTNELTRERVESARERAENQAKIYRGAMIDLQKKYTEEPEMFLEGEYEADFNYIKDGIEDYETFLTLANAELERQSVTDEEISEAIEYFKRLKDYAVEWEKEFPEMPQALDMADLAIKALQAYRPGRGVCDHE